MLCIVVAMEEHRTPAVKLEQLRLEGRSRGLEWLGIAINKTNPDYARQLAQAAGLTVTNATGGWLSVAVLREALVEHLAPERSLAPEVFAW